MAGQRVQDIQHPDLPSYGTTLARAVVVVAVVATVAVQGEIEIVWMHATGIRTRLSGLVCRSRASSRTRAHPTDGRPSLIICCCRCPSIWDS